MQLGTEGERRKIHSTRLHVSGLSLCSRLELRHCTKSFTEKVN